MSSPSHPFTVRAVECDHQASADEVYEALKRATEPLTAAWVRLRRAKRIAIKFNQDKEPHNRVYYNGQLQQLVSESVARAVLRLLRERTQAELVAADVSFYATYNGADVGATTTFSRLFEEFGVRYIDGTIAPCTFAPVPGGGQMFAEYPVLTEVLGADEVISVAKMKNHAFLGLTLTLKNLFGLMPTEPRGRPRTYYHHLVRMPFMLADLASMFDPALNIVDGLVAQAGREWGTGGDDGPVRLANTLIAGDNTVTTDACAASLMGHSPTADWPEPPFHRDRNALLVAADGGYGTVDLEQVDFRSEVDAPVGAFYAVATDSPARVLSWRRTTCEQALRYLDRRHELAAHYAGQYVLLQEGEVRWSSHSGRLRNSRRELAGSNPEQAMWLKLVDPDEREGEQYEIYQRTLDGLT